MRTTATALLAAALVAPTAFGLSYSHGHPHNARRHGAQIARRRLDDHVNATAQRMTRKARRGTASSSSLSKQTSYQSTAIWWAEAGWIGSCGENISDDAMIIALPLALYPDVSTASSLCGTSVSVSAPSTGKTITATVIGASDRDNFTTFSRAAYEALGGNLDVGELAIDFQLVDGTAPASAAGAAATVPDGAALKAGKGTSSPAAVTSSVASSSSASSSGSASDSGSGSGASSSTAAPVQVKANAVPSSSSTTSYVAPTTSDASSSSSSWTSTTTWAPEPTTTTTTPAWDSASAASASAASKSSADAAWASSSSAAADAAYQLWASSSSAAALAASQSAADAAWASSSSAAAAAASKSSADAAWAASSSSSAAAAAAKATQQAAASDSGSSSSSGGGSGQVYSGGIATFFYQNGVAGNCGQVHDDSTLLVALPTATYAGGSHCGSYVAITRSDTGQTIKALVADSCPTCNNNSCLDLSWGAFSALGGTQSMGVFDITWQFV